MPEIKFHDTKQGVKLGFEINLNDIGEWHPTVTQVRETINRGLLVGSHMMADFLPPEVMNLAPSSETLDQLCRSGKRAITAGRLIDFGYWTNNTIKHGGTRGGPLYAKGIIAHPFRQPYVFMHSWEAATSVYMINPLEPDKPNGDCECVEIQPVVASGQRFLMIGDMVMLSSHDQQDYENSNHNRYVCSSIPSVWRFLPGAEAINGGPPAEAAAGNVLDPVMTAMLILATRGITRETISVSEKLQKARRRNGKPPIPPYDRVISEPYVTAIETRRARGRVEASKGGTHASPIPHLRMGHVRQYASGVQTWVRDTLVNMSAETKAKFVSTRSHYVVK